MSVRKRNLVLTAALAAAACSTAVWATSPAASPTTATTHFPAVALSHDAQHLAWITAHAGKTELMLGSASGNNAHAVDIPGDCTETGLRWARRWNKLMVMTHCADSASAIWLLDVHANKPPREITNFSGLARGMRWTTGDEGVAFLYAPRGANQRVASVRTAGGAPTVLTPANLNVREFDWTATGPGGIVYTVAPPNGNGAATRLYTQWAKPSAKPVLIVDTQTSTELRNRYLRLPRWTLSSALVYFLATPDSTASAAGNLYRVPAAGGMLYNMTLGPAVKPSWFKVTGRGIIGTRLVGDHVEVVAYGHGTFGAGLYNSSRPAAIFFSLPGTLTDGTEPLSVSLSWRRRPRIAFVQNSTGQPPIVRSGILSTQPPPAVLPASADGTDASTH